jgi:Ca2+-binding RTX toxin-like protein
MNIKLALAAVVLGSTAPPASAEDAVPPVIELRRAEIVGIGTSPSKATMAKVGADLMALHAEYQAHLQQTSGKGTAAPAFQSSNTIAPIAGGSVVIDTAASGDPEALSADLRALGAENVAVFGRVVSGRLPITAMPALEDLSSLQFARPAYATTNVGRVTSQGDAAMRADIARAIFGVDGTGIMVGTLSDSFNCLGGAAAGIASGDLPVEITVRQEGPCADGLTDEGRGMMEIIHDVAPGASQAFHTAFNGQANGEPDNLFGTPGNDVIHGLAGNDTIAGRGGNDVICGGPDRDRLSGNCGNDQLFGDAGNDVLKGGTGRDRLSGQNGDDTMDGQSGSDRCNGGRGNDRAASCESTARVP